MLLRLSWLAALLWLGGSGLASASNDGEYLFRIAGCLGCHTAKDGPPLAGGRALETPFGTFYSPNISPDPQTGIGSWERSQFIRALRQGLSPGGSPYYPAFPYSSYQYMSESDAGAIFDYLHSRDPVAQANRPHELPWWMHWRVPLHGWQLLFLGRPQVPLEDPELERGRYLVDALGHCGECHTPRGRLGQKDPARYLGGARLPPDDELAPNLTPDRERGLGKWRTDDIEYLLETGELPDGDYVGGHMAEVVDNGTTHLTPQDRRAMVRWLRAIPGISGKP